MLGGALGSILITGLKRGVFSNEAGLGSVANIAATADVKHPVKQGMIQSFGVLVDTLVVCTFTALVVLSYGTFDQILALGAITGDGANLVQGIIADTAFGSAANYIIAIFPNIFKYHIDMYFMNPQRIEVKHTILDVFDIRTRNGHFCTSIRELL